MIKFQKIIKSSSFCTAIKITSRSFNKSEMFIKDSQFGSARSQERRKEDGKKGKSSDENSIYFVFLHRIVIPDSTWKPIYLTSLRLPRHWIRSNDSPLEPLGSKQPEAWNSARNHTYIYIYITTFSLREFSRM